MCIFVCIETIESIISRYNTRVDGLNFCTCGEICLFYFIFSFEYYNNYYFIFSCSCLFFFFSFFKSFL